MNIVPPYSPSIRLVSKSGWAEYFPSALAAAKFAARHGLICKFDPWTSGPHQIGTRFEPQDPLCNPLGYPLFISETEFGAPVYVGYSLLLHEQREGRRKRIEAQPQRSPGAKRRHRSYYRKPQTLKERKGIEATNAELKEFGIHPGHASRVRKPVQAWDDICYARRSKGWKSHRKTQYKTKPRGLRG